MASVRQQINLYQPSGDAGAGGGGAPVPFAAGTAGLIAAAVGACLLAVWGFGMWRVQHLERALETLRRQQQQQSETMAALVAARATGVSAEQLDATIKALTAALDTHSRTLELLRGGGAGQISGFSSHLAALAHRPVEGLWLDHVVLSGLNGAMSVGGSALDPQLVPRYLNGLGAENALAGIRFDQFVIEQPPAPSAGEKPQPEQSAGRHFNFRAESASLHLGGQDQRS
jgi:hypothetical protein